MSNPRAHEQAAIKAALEKIGFKISNFGSIYKGTALFEPVYNFVDAWTISDVLWEDETRRTGSFLVCQEPGTGNVAQSFDLSRF